MKLGEGKFMKNNTEQEARWWTWAAWTSPFVALAILIGETLLDINTRPTSLIIVVTFITTSVFWWWWAISKIVYMIKCSHKMEDSFNNLRDELIAIKKDVGDRQWREPKEN